MNKQKLLERIQDLTHPLSPISIDHPTKLDTLTDIQCVAFDFYGTMFISSVGDIGVDKDQQEHSEAFFSESLRDTGFEILKDEVGGRGNKLFEETIDKSVTAAQKKGIDHPEPDLRAVWWDVLTKLTDEQLIEGELTKERVIQFGIEFEFRINNIWPVPNLKTVLTTLLNQDIRLGIISNSQYYTPLAFEAFYEQSPEEFGFDPNLITWSYQARLKKPSVDFYKQFAKTLTQENLISEEVLYVGNDIRKDIAPAKSLGMKTALYVGDKRSIRHKPGDIEKEAYKPDLIIDDLTQLTNCISAG
ncbi:HAD family hydrolase [Aliifodinibius salicampi]|uniref:HAD family hydrolase n=1 Tax=Fodinibius salicampi TaxID=1920655 RepID=A0ABT3PVW8_9BACT|nr:HAD family hydrolase [Fodinibius salicampi]MCW9712002.1 HAD family hydrolase [Fodinibius salicampi]